VEQDSEEHEDHVYDVKSKVEALGSKVVYDVYETENEGDDPEDLGVLDLLSRSILGVDPVSLFLEMDGVYEDGVLLIGMHSVAYQRHYYQDDTAHDEVHGVENGVHSRSLIENFTEFLTVYQLERDGTGKTCVPYYET
jgi:hypothetical protein